jgi:hypothetical protein
MRVQGLSGESVYVKTHWDKTAIAASVDPAWRADPVYMTPNQLRKLINALTTALQRTAANTGKEKAPPARRGRAKK